MTWHPIGYRVVGPFDGEVSVGRFAGILPGGILHLLATYHGISGPDPLSFGIFDFLNDDGIRSLGSEKWWPRPQPSAVRLGPAPEEEAEGRILFRLRSYNTGWIRHGLPEPRFAVSVQAWLPVGSSEPLYCPAGFVVGATEYGLPGDAADSSLAYPLAPKVPG